MDKACMVCLLLFALALGGTLLSSGGLVAAADLASCRGFSESQSKCMQYVRPGAKRVVPSQACCQAIRNSDMECECKNVTPEFEKAISWPLIVSLANYCQKPLKSGSTCGSFVVP